MFAPRQVWLCGPQTLSAACAALSSCLVASSAALLAFSALLRDAMSPSFTRTTWGGGGLGGEMEVYVTGWKWSDYRATTGLMKPYMLGHTVWWH